MSCELLGSLVKVNVILSCTSCTDSQLQTVTDDSPIVISEFPAGNYTVNVTAVDISNDIIRTVEVIVMSEDVTTDMSPTSGPTTSANFPTTIYIDTPATTDLLTSDVSTTNGVTTNVPSTTSTPSTMYTDTPTATAILTSDVLTTNGATTNVPTTTSTSSATDSPTTGNVHY